jgi:hypothetical protein
MALQEQQEYPGHLVNGIPGSFSKIPSGRILLNDPHQAASKGILLNDPHRAGRFNS